MNSRRFGIRSLPSIIKLFLCQMQSLAGSRKFSTDMMTQWEMPATMAPPLKQKIVERPSTWKVMMLVISFAKQKQVAAHPACRIHTRLIGGGSQSKSTGGDIVTSILLSWLPGLQRGFFDFNFLLESGSLNYLDVLLWLPPSLFELFSALPSSSSIPNNSWRLEGRKVSQSLEEE